MDLKTIPEVAAVMSSVESRLAGNGRLLVRYSGTEPLLRVMLEGKDAGRNQALGRRRSSTRSSSMSERRCKLPTANSQRPRPSAAWELDRLGVGSWRSCPSTSTRSRPFGTRAAAACRRSLDAVKACIAAGSPGITVHPRADARHITAADVREISSHLRSLDTPRGIQHRGRSRGPTCSTSFTR